VVDNPFGLTVAFNVTEFEVMLVAELVVAAGAVPEEDRELIRPVPFGLPHPVTRS